MAISSPALSPSSPGAPAQTTVSTSTTARSTRPTDDEILGIVPEAPQNKLAAQSSAAANESSNAAAEIAATIAEPEQFRAIFEANPSLRDAWQDAQTFREIFPDVQSAREIQKLFPTAEDARAAGAQLADLAKLDTLFFSNRPESHAELAAAAYRLNPAAFRNLARMMQAISNDAGNASELSSRVVAAASDGAADSPRTPRTDALMSPNPAANLVADPNGAAQVSFFHDTNAAAVNGVLDAIQSQMDRLLPEGTTDNARQRLVGEIYREVDAALRSNHAFGQQLRQAFRAGNWSPENRQAIAGMVVARARQALPGIAKKVINEWTSGVVAQSSARVQRQRTAERRVDIADGAPGGDGRRALSPRDLDYRRLSDADILNL